MTEQGRFDEFIDADRDRHLQGPVEAGFIVRAGVTLTIDGPVGGGGSVEAGGELNVRGVFNATIYGNEGSIYLSGILNELPQAFIAGRVFVGAGSLVTARGTTYLVNADGSKRHLRAGHTYKNLSPSEDTWLELTHERNFVPVP